MKTLTPAEMLSKGIAIASEAHTGQLDKGGAPYILHPLRVMNAVAVNRDYETMTVAILHDVFEDTELGLYETLEGFSPRVTFALQVLTHHKSEPYEQYIERIAKSNSLDAIHVKLADLRDNSDITRMKGLRQKDFDRLIKYNKAFDYLRQTKEGQSS